MFMLHHINDRCVDRRNALALIDMSGVKTFRRGQYSICKGRRTTIAWYLRVPRRFATPSSPVGRFVSRPRRGAMICATSCREAWAPAVSGAVSINRSASARRRHTVIAIESRMLIDRRSPPRTISRRIRSVAPTLVGAAHTLVGGRSPPADAVRTCAYVVHTYACGKRTRVGAARTHRSAGRTLVGAART